MTKEERKTYNREYYKEYKKSDKWKEYMKVYQEKRNKSEKRKEEQKRYRNSLECKLYRREYMKNRKLKDPLFHLICNISSRIKQDIRRKNFTKKSRTYEILGCSYEEFKNHIENQFKDGMTWENYGEWQYDHIIPISSATNEAEVIRLNHYTNFQPLWKFDNLKKSNKITNP